MLELDRGPRPCLLELGSKGDGWLYFQDPLGGDRNECIPVTTGPSEDRKRGDGLVMPYWHIDVEPDGTIVTNPSIKLNGKWHIAPGARWTPTPSNPDGTWPKD